MIRTGLAAKLTTALSLMVMAVPSLAMGADGSLLPVGLSDGDTGKIGGTASADAVAKLANAMRAEIAPQVATGSAEDLEGLIVFVVSQGNYSDDVISGALDSVSVGANENLLTAIANVRLALLKKKLKKGTAAIGNGTGNGTGGGFSSPGGGPGGGGSNYSS